MAVLWLFLGPIRAYEGFRAEIRNSGRSEPAGFRSNRSRFEVQKVGVGLLGEISESVEPTLIEGMP
jgi:hypothetical protein